MNVDRIILTPKQIQKLLDWIEVIPTEHYICISRNIDMIKYIFQIVEKLDLIMEKN